MSAQIPEHKPNYESSTWTAGTIRELEHKVAALEAQKAALERGLGHVWDAIKAVCPELEPKIVEKALKLRKAAMEEKQ